MACSGFNIFGDNSCESGLTPEQEQDLTDVVDKTINLSAVQLPTPITTLTGELDVKKIKSYEHNAEIEFDNTNLLLTADGNINISGPIIADTIQCGDASNTEGYTLLDKVNLQFRGDKNTSSAYGAVTYFDNINNKSIILGIDRGNFPNPSEVKIFVDSQIYQFSTTGLDMLLKQITNLAEPDLPQDAATKNYVDGSVNLQNAYDRGPDILTKVGTPLTITGPAGIEIGGNLKVYDPDGVSPNNTSVRLDSLLFKGDPLVTSFGSLSYLDAVTNKEIRLAVNKGNFPNSSRFVVSLDNTQFYTFTSNALSMGTKPITNLAEPTLSQDAATKNYVDGLQPNQSLNTTNNVLFNSVQSTTSINANTVDAITDVTVGVEGVDAVKLSPTLLTFRGDAINTSYGQIQYGDGNVKKTISMTVQKGNFTAASEARILVDDGYYYFTPTALNMVNKRIASLAEPINTQDAATKNYVNTAIAPVLTVANAGGKIKVSFNNSTNYVTTVNPIWTDNVISIGWDATSDTSQIMVNNEPSVGNIAYYVTPGNLSNTIGTGEYGIQTPVNTIGTRQAQRLWVQPSNPASGLSSYLFTIFNIPTACLTIEKW